MTPPPTPAVRPAARFAPTRRTRAGRAALALAATLALAAGGCAATRGGAGDVVTSGPPVELPAGSFARQWAADLDLQGDNRVTGLHRVGDDLFAYTADNLVFALTPGGSTRFVRRVGGPGAELLPPVSTAVRDDDSPEGATAASPGAADAAERASRDARIVFPTTSGFEVYGLGGGYEKTVDSAYPLSGPAVAGSGLVFAGVSGPTAGRVAAFDLGRTYANERWAIQAGTVTGRPAFHRGVVYYASADGRVYAAASDRSSPWALPGGAFRTDRAVVADLVADDYALYVASTDSKLYAIDRATGRLRWQYFAQAPLREAPVVTADAVYQAVPGNGVVKVAKAEGDAYREPLWRAEGVARVLSVGGGYVYGLDRAGRIVAVDDATGEVRFTSRSSGFSHFEHDAAGTTIYAATDDGRIVAVRPVLAPGGVGVLVWAPAGGDE